MKIKGERMGFKEGIEEFLLVGDDHALWVHDSARRRPRGGCGAQRGYCWPFGAATESYCVSDCVFI